MKSGIAEYLERLPGDNKLAVGIKRIEGDPFAEHIKLIYKALVFALEEIDSMDKFDRDYDTRRTTPQTLIKEITEALTRLPK